MVICEVFLLVMAYVPTPSHGAPVGVAKATVHIFSNAMGRVTVTLVRPKEQFHTPHCGYAFPIASHLLLPAPVSLTVNPFLVRLVI